MTTPNRIFDIARENVIARALTQRWLCGGIEWEEMLFELIDAIEEQCNKLVDENNLCEIITDKSTLGLLNHLVEESLKPDLRNIESPVERQRKLIGVILFMNEFYKNILALAVKSIEYKSPVLVIKLGTLRNLEYLSESVPENISRKKAEYETGVFNEASDA